MLFSFSLVHRKIVYLKQREVHGVSQQENIIRITIPEEQLWENLKISNDFTEKLAQEVQKIKENKEWQVVLLKPMKKLINTGVNLFRGIM